MQNKKKEEHVKKCMCNHKGSSASIETDGVKRFQSHGLHYTEYFGDSDRKAHADVEEE